jgi:hypothetical protein
MPDAMPFSTDASHEVTAPQANNAIPIAILLDTGTLLVAGLAEEPPPEAAGVTCSVAGRPVTGAWQSRAWPDMRGDHGYAFVAVLQAEHASHLYAVPLTLEAHESLATMTLPGIERLELDIEPLIDWLDRQGGERSRTFDFIRAALIAVEGVQPRCDRFLEQFLTAISDHDGFIEIVAEPEGGGVLLQGWAVHLPARSVPVILMSGRLVAADAAVAHFHRSDLLPSARGFIAFSLCRPDCDLMTVRKVFFREAERYYRLDVVENRVHLEPAHVVGHLHDMLPRLEGPRDSLRALKRVCRPRFAGHETISQLSCPVRVACDLAVQVTGHGLFLSGWLLDPKRLVEKVILKSTRDFYARIEGRMVRTPRPDVSDGFRNEPLFADCLDAWNTLHGFMVFVPRADRPAEGETFYLELVFEDQGCAFLPITWHKGGREDLVQQILASVDIDAAEIDRLVADHLSPLVMGLAAKAAALRQAAAIVPFGPERENDNPPAVSVIVPLGAEWRDLDVNLARFAGDRDFASVELIVVADRAAAERIAQPLRRAAAFYRLRGRLVLSAAPCDRFDGFVVGAAVAASERLLLLAPSVLPRERGWLGRLLADMAELPSHAALCPSLLYEDHSIRFAGGDHVATTGEFAAGSCTGYAASAIDATTVRAVAVGVLDCCLIDRSMFAAVSAFPGPYFSERLKSLDFALSYRAAGGQFFWSPTVALYALDDGAPAEEEPHWRRVCRLIDQRSFESRWRTAPNPLAGR